MFDLFAALDATDEQLDFPILYGSAKQGWMADSPDGPKDGMGPLIRSGAVNMCRRRGSKRAAFACSALCSRRTRILVVSSRGAYLPAASSRISRSRFWIVRAMSSSRGGYPRFLPSAH